MLYFARWKTTLILLSVVAAIAFFIPNFFARDTVSNWPDWLPKQQIVLGLDLRGGSHLLLEVDRESIVRDHLNTLRDDVRRVLRDERIGYTGLGSQGDAVQVRVRETSELDRAREALQTLAQPVGGSMFGTSGAATVQISAESNGLLRLSLTPQGIDQNVRNAVNQSIEIVRRRVDELGTVEPNIQREGESRMVVQVPGLDDPERLKALIGQTARLTFQMVDVSMSAQQAQQGRPPADSTVLPGSGDDAASYLIDNSILVSGEDLVDAQPGFDQQTNEPIVTFRFNTSGARRFGSATQQNVGRPFAIVLDNEVISAPVIREPILGGTGQISGGFSVEEANDLAVLLRAGALPAPLNIIEERTVGPSLGQDSIEAGWTAGLIATGAVAVFMVAIYGLFGAFALVALTINIIMLLSILSILGATLTLPGIAGIILTIGMAVDSNVVIFERIRDEAREGRSPLMAIDKGFSFALGTIMDANITSFVTALILFLFGGSGPVRGFAVVFMIGIATTVFTAYMLTRLILATWVRRVRPTALPV